MSTKAYTGIMMVNIPYQPGVNEPVLIGQHEEERGEQAAWSAGRVGVAGDEFAQREERDERENEGAPLADGQRGEEHDHHHPPTVDARVEIGHRGPALVCFRPPPRDQAGDAGDDEDAEDGERKC